MTNLNLSAANLEGKVIQSYTDFVINSETATNQTGIKNGFSMLLASDCHMKTVIDKHMNLKRIKQQYFLCIFVYLML